MKKLLLKAGFVVAVLVLMMVLLVPAMAALEALFPARRGADGLYGSNDRLWPGVLATFASLWVANRVTSSLFCFARISDGRWSLFKAR